MNWKMKVLAFAMFVVGLMATGSSLFAHHGDAAYTDKMLEFKNAVVTEYRWQNPHSLIKVRVKDEKGEETIWTMEMGSTPSMGQLGSVSVAHHLALRPTFDSLARRRPCRVADR